jgi:hypothetical protein
VLVCPDCGGGVRGVPEPAEPELVRLYKLEACIRDWLDGHQAAVAADLSLQRLVGLLAEQS